MLVSGQGTLVNDPVLGLERHLARSLYEADRLNLEEISTWALPEDQDVVCALELDGPFFKDFGEHQFCLWEQFIKEIRGGNRGLLWLTQPSQISTCTDPEYRIVIGLARKLRAEMNLAFTTVEIDRLDDSSLEYAVKILNEFGGRFTEDAVQPTAEWAIVGGQALIGRYHPMDVTKELRGNRLQFRSDRAYLFVGGSGRTARSVATWLVERGAQHIVFFEDSEAKAPENNRFHVELESMWCTTIYV